MKDLDIVNTVNTSFSLVTPDRRSGKYKDDIGRGFVTHKGWGKGICNVLISEENRVE